jgi:hypothetical protein
MIVTARSFVIPGGPVEVQWKKECLVRLVYGNYVDKWQDFLPMHFGERLQVFAQKKERKQGRKGSNMRKINDS